MARQSYPVGVPDFPRIRQLNSTYVDKTAYVYELTHTAAYYYFLSRPRRFGKTVLVSTLQAYFEGCKELFKGLEIERLEKEWTVYPVLHFDMSTAKYVDAIGLKSELNRQLRKLEAVYGRNECDTEPNQRLMGLIERAYAKDGKGVVVLIDEYDAPLLDVVHEKERLTELRQIMRNFYSPLKACAPYLRFVFLTGITKFSQLSIFSELNNLCNISMLNKYAAICGITEEELLAYFRPGIEDLAEALELSFDEALAQLKLRYDGYHFAAQSPDIYNPFSLLNAMETCKLANYWFSSGTPTYVVELLRKYNAGPLDIGNHDEDEDSFDVPPEQMRSIVPLLYQSGYLTIKSYDKLRNSYHLDLPNQEVRVGLMRNLLPAYVDAAHTSDASRTMREAQVCIRQDDIDGALEWVQKFLLTVPYCDRTDYEGHYQQLLYVLFSLLGYYVDIEIRTATGRIDMVCMTSTHLYIIEIKLGKSADAALRQINLKDYAARYSLCRLPATKVGVTFDATRHTLGAWTTEDIAPLADTENKPETAG